MQIGEIIKFFTNRGKAISFHEINMLNVKRKKEKKKAFIEEQKYF